jgi:tetratricopeptide (TPR) repeat protein
MTIPSIGLSVAASIGLLLSLSASSLANPISPGSGDTNSPLSTERSAQNPAQNPAQSPTEVLPPGASPPTQPAASNSNGRDLNALKRVLTIDGALVTELTFVGNENEAIIATWQHIDGVSENPFVLATLYDSAGNEFEGVSVALEGTSTGNWRGDHRAFVLPKSGQYRLVLSGGNFLYSDPSAPDGLSAAPIDYIAGVRLATLDERWLLQGETLFVEDRFEAAIAAYTQAIDLNPNLLGAYLGRLVAVDALAIAIDPQAFEESYNNYTLEKRAEIFQRLSPERQSLFIADLRQSALLIRELSFIGNPILVGMPQPDELFSDIADFLETGEKSEFLINAFGGETSGEESESVERLSESSVPMAVSAETPAETSAETPEKASEETIIRLEERVQQATAPVSREFTFTGQANETIVVHESALSDPQSDPNSHSTNFVLTDPAGNEVEQYHVSLAGTRSDEWAGRHALFTLPATGEYRLTFNVYSSLMDGAPKPGVDYRLRVRSSSAVDRSLLEAVNFFYEERYSDAITLYGEIIKDHPDLLTAYIGRSQMHLLLAQSLYTSQPDDGYSLVTLNRLYAALSPEQQALVRGDLRQMSKLMNDAIAQGQPMLDDVMMAPEFFSELAIFLESGEIGEYLKAFFGE